MTTLFILLLGLATVIISIVVASKFFTRGGSGPLPKALAWQLIGEAVIGLGTLGFAIMAHFGILPHVSIDFQSAMRFGMFLATSVTTLHLWFVVLRLDKREDG